MDEYYQSGYWKSGDYAVERARRFLNQCPRVHILSIEQKIFGSLKNRDESEIGYYCMCDEIDDCDQSYQVMQLKNVAGKVLSKAIYVENVEEMWKISHLYDVEDLACVAIKFMVKHWPKLSGRIEIQELLERFPKLKYTISILTKPLRFYNKSNVCEIWRLAYLHKAENIGRKTTVFMAACWPALEDDDDYRELCEKHEMLPFDIMDMTSRGM